MMIRLGLESARASATIRKTYREHMDLLFLDQYSDLQGALETGGLVSLPADALRFNLAPRREGLFPIGEKDLDNQESYISARPATIGVLLEVAARVRSGPLEITSLVRHGEYQESLKRTNSNATTSIPMHTMGLAFDIALINTPLETVYEIRDVLRSMQKAGDLLFIGERKQLVFHVVPHPARLGHFTDVYTARVGPPQASRVAHVIGRAPQRPHTAKTTVPRVIAEIAAILPADDRLADAWWGSPEAAADIDESATKAPVLQPEDLTPKAAGTVILAGALVRACLALFAALLATASRITAPAPRLVALFQ
jgi:hypothetical protein